MNIFSNENSPIAAYKTKYNTYVSVTEYTELLNYITETNDIKPYMVNKQLCDSGALRYLGSGIYKHTYRFSEFCKEIYMDNYSFHTWDTKFVFLSFGVNLNKKINNRTINNFCSILRKYNEQKLNKRIIKHHLEDFQSYLSNNILQEINKNYYSKKER